MKEKVLAIFSPAAWTCILRPRCRVPQELAHNQYHQGAHQLVLLLHLGHALLTPLVPMLQLSYHCLALLTQNLLVFNQL